MDWTGSKGKKGQQSISEVRFAQHLLEFIRFFDRQAQFCDIISGLKPKHYVHDGQDDYFTITKHNFGFALRELNSFIITYLHNVKTGEERLLLETAFDDLEQQFINDLEYDRLSKLVSPSLDDLAKLNYKYINYLIRCFKISNSLCASLQASMMVSTKDIQKYVKFYDERQFYDNLTNYKSAVGDALGNMTYADLFNVFMKVIGYYYTYKILIDARDVAYLDELIDNLLVAILERKVILLASKSEAKDNIGNDDQMYIKSSMARFKKIYGHIFSTTNTSLSEKRILPKIEIKVLEDRTQI